MSSINYKWTLSKDVKKSVCMQAFIDGIEEVNVSLDFCDANKHTEFRGQPKAYRWTIDMLALCKEYNKLTTIVFLGSEKNINHKNLDGNFSIAKKYGVVLRMNMHRPTEGSCAGGVYDRRYLWHGTLNKKSLLSNNLILIRIYLIGRN